MSVDIVANKIQKNVIMEFSMDSTVECDICDKCKAKESYCCTNRKVAWAKYYEEKEKVKILLNLIEKLSDIRMVNFVNNVKKKDNLKIFKMLKCSHVHSLISKSIKMDNSFNCSICFNKVNNDKMFIPLCGHEICTECALNCICRQKCIKDTECPQCRKPLCDGMKKPIDFLRCKS